MSGLRKDPDDGVAGFGVFVGGDGPEIEEDAPSWIRVKTAGLAAPELQPDFIGAFSRGPKTRGAWSGSVRRDGAASDLGAAVDDGKFEFGRKKGLGQGLGRPCCPALELAERFDSIR